MLMIMLLGLRSRATRSRRLKRNCQRLCSPNRLTNTHHDHDDADDDNEDIRDNVSDDDGDDKTICWQAKKGVDMERLALGPGGQHQDHHHYFVFVISITNHLHNFVLMSSLWPGKPSKHPPKKQMVSKYAKAGKGDR